MNDWMRKIGRAMRSSIAVLIVLQLAVAAPFFMLGGDSARPVAERGALDLSDWDAGRDAPVELNGQWEFYWLRQLKAADFRSDSPPPPDLLAAVPDEWNGYRIGDGSGSLSGTGYGTYRLTIKVREEGERLALKALPLSTAYTIYANDRLLASRGQAGADRSRFRADTEPATVEFTAPARTFELIVQVSNFGYAKGGFNRPLLLGSPEAIHALNQKLVYKDLFLLGSLVIAGFYSLSMFFMNREEKVSLYFALVCIVFICRIPLSGSYMIFEMFPRAGIQVTEWINYMTFHGGVLVYALMIREFFPALFPGRIRRCLIVLTLFIFALLIVLPVGVYSRYYLVSDVVGLAAVACSYYVSARAAVVRMPYAWPVCFGHGLLLAFVVADIVDTELNRNEMGYFSNYGFFVFIFVYAFILARRFSMSFKEAKSLSRKLLELDKLKDEFLANTSHELKTPLQGIINITESLIEGVEGPLAAGQTRNLELVAASGRRLANLINDILDISKLKHGDIRLSRKAVNVQPLAEFTLLIIRQMYPHKRIEWVQDIARGLPPVYADENRLVQILYNLIGNAAKFTEQGEIKIAAAQRDGSVAITVSDTGIGIRPEQMDTIFQAFAQGDASIVREYGGVGLGLSITKHLIELHGGHIEAEAAPGRGARFTFALPAAGGERAAQAAAGTQAPDNAADAVAVGVAMSKAEAAAMVEEAGPPAFRLSAGGALRPPYGEGRSPGDERPRSVVQSGEHILVADDDRASLQSLVNLLKLEGYTVTAVDGGRQALEALRAIPDIRLVVLDVMMPGMSGYEVCRAIRQTKPLFELPVLMVTAKHQPEDLALGFEAGANDFLVKPFEPTEFKARVRTLTELNKSMHKAVQAEIAFLQAQIKPHFLYNTLNTIAYFCTRDGKQAKQLLNHFSNYLRNGFDFKSLEAVVPLAKELEFVHTYVEIEKARFGDRLETIFDVEEGVEAVKIPPLVLQPLVENAIRHGAMKKIAGGLVVVSVKRAGAGIVFHVSDTGVGIAPGKLDALLSADRPERGIGLRNIHMRLQTLYGTGIRISSTEGEGTEVEFTIPAIEGEAS